MKNVCAIGQRIGRLSCVKANIIATYTSIYRSITQDFSWTTICPRPQEKTPKTHNNKTTRKLQAINLIL